MMPSDLVTHYGEWIQPERCQTKGLQPKPRWMPLPKLLYAQHEAGLRQQLALFQAHHNFGLPHASLCLPLPEVEMITEPGLPSGGDSKRWRWRRD